MDQYRLDQIGIDGEPLEFDDAILLDDNESTIKSWSISIYGFDFPTRRKLSSVLNSREKAQLQLVDELGRELKGEGLVALVSDNFAEIQGSGPLFEVD